MSKGKTGEAIGYLIKSDSELGLANPTEAGQVAVSRGIF